MNISSVSAKNGINQIHQMDPAKMKEKMQELQNSGMMDTAHFSDASKMMNFLSGLDSTGKQEMKEFHNSIFQSAKAGNVDSAELASQAPEELKAFAEENGINLEEMVSRMMEMKDKPRASFSMSKAPQPYAQSADEETNIIDLLFPSDENEES